MQRPCGGKEFAVPEATRRLVWGELQSQGWWGTRHPAGSFWMFEDFGLYYKYFRKLLESLKAGSHFYFNKKSLATTLNY